MGLRVLPGWEEDAQEAEVGCACALQLSTPAGAYKILVPPHLWLSLSQS